MHKFIVCLAVYVVLLSSFFSVGFAADDINPLQLESKLPTVSGAQRIKILERLAWFYREKDAEKTLAFGKEGLELLENKPDFSIRASFFNHMAAAQKKRENHAEARNYAESALKNAEAVGDQPNRALALYHLADLAQQDDRYGEALKYGEQAELIFQQLTWQRETAGVTRVISQTYWQMGDFDTAVHYCLKTLEIYKTLNNQNGIAEAYNMMGAIHARQKNYKEAEKYIHQAVSIYEGQNNRIGAGRSYHNIGTILLENKKYLQAHQYFNKALDYIGKDGSIREIAHTTSNIGLVYEAREDYEKALEYTIRANQLAEKAGNPRIKAITQFRVGRVYRHKGDYIKALQNLEQAHQLAHPLRNIFIDMEIHQETAIVHEALKQYQKALFHHKEFKQLSDSIFNENKTKAIAQLQNHFDARTRRKEIEILKKNEKIQQLDLDRQQYITRFVMIICFLIFVVASITYARYRLKVNVTRQLTREMESHRQTAERLKESEQKFRNLAETASVGIYVLRGKEVEYANPRLAEIFDFPIEELIGKSPEDFVVEEDKKLVREALSNRMKGKYFNDGYEFRALTRSGELIYLESYASAEIPGDPPLLMGTLVDITARKRAEIELLNSRKLESVGILAGGLAHDFNNLLAIILGSISTVRDALLGQTKLSRMLKHAENASAQAADLAQKLITFSEGGWVLIQQTSVHEIIKHTLEYYPAFAPLVKETLLPNDLVHVNGDERQLRQVVHNILQNAVDASPHGKIHIAVAAVNISIPPANPFSLAGGKYVKLTISDKGKGIPEDMLRNIFDPYFSTKADLNQKGQGLGLTICYSIIKKHNGHIEVESFVGKGTSVHIYLPAFNSATQRPDTSA